MNTSRRSLFGWLAGAVVAAPAVVEAAAPAAPVDPGPFLGQIRAVHSHYEAVPYYPPGSSQFSSTTMTQAISVCGYEQWNGSAWAPISALRHAAPDLNHSHVLPNWPLSPTHSHPPLSREMTHNHPFLVGTKT